MVTMWGYPFLQQEDYRFILEQHRVGVPTIIYWINLYPRLSATTFTFKAAYSKITNIKYNKKGQFK